MRSTAGSLLLPSPRVAIADHVLFCLRNTSSGNPRRLLQIQSQIVTNPCVRAGISILSQFVSSCARCLGPHYASLFLRHLPSSDVSLWNLVIRSSEESDSGMQFMTFYDTMIRVGVYPDKATFSLILSALSRLSVDNLGEAVHCRILKMGYYSDMFLRTGLLDFYAKIGRLASAQQLFGEMPDKDVVINNTMIATLSNHGCVADARQLFDGMHVKSSASWNSMITCYCRCNQIDAARDIFDRNPVKDVISWNAMINGYCKVGQLEAARELFDKMGSGKNSITWNTMITGYVHHRQFSPAVSMFQQMQAEGVRPTEVTMVSLLSACAHLGALDMGRWIHAYIQNHNFKVDVVLGNALIDMYYKCGSIETALQIFHQIPARNIFCWNSIIMGLGMHGYGEQAIETFFEMQKHAKIKPDGVTFVGLLSGCSHSGMVSEGKKYFSQMMEIYAVEPAIEHYGCMVDLLGRAGLLREALDLVKQMPIKPNSVVWGSLLRACRIHKDSVMSEQVTQHLIELDPKDGDNITRELSKIGYEPHVDSVLHDIEEEEKENAVKYHSEKIAVAYGLLNTREGMQIRIVKNLRVWGRGLVVPASATVQWKRSPHLTI
ncbi:hypothetical protein Taro_041922 [Colocasia esculenta]|uniref:DYW domain-containing protein n=1 Tax=Colocasia esculenta TaxID=4460 RepID=A0A843WV10_COLES|nr:hypothetical protein [Colocasia esculenta]